MTTKILRRRYSNESELLSANLENVFNRAQPLHLPSPDELSSYRADLNRALSEYNLEHFGEAKSILSTLSASLILMLASKIQNGDAAQVHLLYASTLTSLGRTCERLKQEKEATNAFKKAVAEFKKWISEAKEPAGQMYSDYGVALFKIGRKTRAIAAFRKVVGRGILNAEGNRYMGICLGRLRKYKEAEERFSEALKQDPDHYMTHKALAELLEEENRVSDAVKEYHTTILYMCDSGLLDDALAVLEHVLRLTRQDPQFLALKGEILRNKGDLKAALRTLNRSLKRQPKNAFADGVKGLVLLASNQNEKGVRLLKRALELDPTLDWVAVELAVALYKSGHYKKALTALNKALDRNPGNVNALFHKGETLSALGRDEEALLALNEALKLKPNDALLLGKKGRLLRHLNQHKKALKVLQRSKSLNPRIAWVHGELAAVLYALGENYEALQAVIDALAIQPDNIFALSYKGEILRTLGILEQSINRSEEALQIMNQALALDKNNAWAVGTKGQVLGDLGREEEAIEILQQSIDLDPSLAWVHVELSSAQYSVGHYRAALEALDHALRIQTEVDWLVFKGHILCEIAEFGAAVKALDRAIRINKNIAEAFGLKGWALQHLGIKQATRTLRAYELALKIEPDNLWWHKGIANGLYLMNDKGKALARYGWVVKQARMRAKKEKDEAKFLALVAWCQYRLGKCEEAVQLFSQVISFNPEQIASQFDLALALTCCKRYSEAYRAYSRGVRSSKEPPRLRYRGVIYVALDDLKIAIRMQPELAQAEEVKDALTMLEATYDESSEPAGSAYA
jgi:tetratricopeptide (TPR) repeat protein